MCAIRIQKNMSTRLIKSSKASQRSQLSNKSKKLLSKGETKFFEAMKHARRGKDEGEEAEVRGLGLGAGSLKDCTWELIFSKGF